MTRKRTKLAWIANDSARRSTYNKRLASLIKMVNELTTLCGILAFFIVYRNREDRNPTVWPSLLEAERLIAKFRSMDDMDQKKRMRNQETFTKERLDKAVDQLQKIVEKNTMSEANCLMHQISRGRVMDDLSVDELNKVVWLMQEAKNRARRINDYKQQTAVPQSNQGLSIHLCGGNQGMAAPSGLKAFGLNLNVPQGLSSHLFGGNQWMAAQSGIKAFGLNVPQAASPQPHQGLNIHLFGGNQGMAAQGGVGAFGLNVPQSPAVDWNQWSMNQQLSGMPMSVPPHTLMGGPTINNTTIMPHHSFSSGFKHQGPQSYPMVNFSPQYNVDPPDTGMLPPFANTAGASSSSTSNINNTGEDHQGPQSYPTMNFSPLYNVDPTDIGMLPPFANTAGASSSTSNINNTAGDINEDFGQQQISNILGHEDDLSWFGDDTEAERATI